MRVNRNEARTEYIHIRVKSSTKRMAVAMVDPRAQSSETTPITADAGIGP